MVPITRAVRVRDGQVGLHGLGRRGDGRQDGAGWGAVGQGGGCGEACPLAAHARGELFGSSSTQRWKKKIEGEER